LALELVTYNIYWASVSVAHIKTGTADSALWCTDNVKQKEFFACFKIG